MAKPAFDESKPFSSGDNKPAFDESKPFDKSDDYSAGPIETGIASLAPKSVTSAIYGAKEALSAPWGKKLESYRKNRDYASGILSQAEAENPKSAIAGNLVRGALEGAATGASIPALAGVGGIEGLLGSKSDLTKLDDPEQRKQLGKDVGTGTAVAGLLGTAAKYIPETVGPALKEAAGNLAEKATGATRAMAEKFAPGAGRELLDRGIVKFGFSPKDIAGAAEKEMSTSQNTISSALSDLDKQGVKATPEDIANALDIKIGELNKLPGTMPQARKLEGLKEDIMAAMKNESQPLSTIEKFKRSYGNTNWSDPDVAMAQKGAYKTLMGSVEDKATEANPDLADTFKKAKKTYGLLAPIQEAAEKRALQLNQSPIGGLLDMNAIGAGLLTGHEGAGIAVPIARRLLAPRASSAAAVTADQLSNLLSKISPEARSALVGSVLSNQNR